MVFVKVNAEFIPINDLAEAAAIPVERVEEFVNKGLLATESAVESYFPDAVHAIRRLKLVFELNRHKVTKEIQRNIIRSLDQSECIDSIRSVLTKANLSEDEYQAILEFVSDRYK